MSRHPETGLTWRRRFLPLFALFQAGTFNDNALKNALIALITFGGVAFLSDLPSGIRVPVAALIFTGPFTLLCAIAGQLADKVDRGIIFRWIKRVEVGIMLLAALGFYLMDVRILAVALGLMGAQSAFFSPTKNAVLPQWLTEKELIKGNALMSGFQFAIILAATIFGLAVLKVGAATLSIVLVALAIFGWMSAEFCPPAPPPKPGVSYENRNLVWAIIQLPFLFAFCWVLGDIIVGAADAFESWTWLSWLYTLIALLVLAAIMTTIGWLANGKRLLLSEEEKGKNVNFDIVSATIQVVAKACKHPDVLRPLLGVSWFYALSTVFVTTLPDFVAQTMGYSAEALQILLASSTISILIGALIVFAVGNMKVWGPESIRLTTLGIIGVAICTWMLITIPTPRYQGTEAFGPVDAFLADPAALMWIVTLSLSSVFSGMFIVPLQAMAQRRAEPLIRAQLMSAGSVLLNLFVNVTTFSLIALGALALGPTVPFWIIIGGSSVVAAYSIYRSIVLVERPQPGIAKPSTE
jgi:MFS family permease